MVFFTDTALDDALCRLFQLLQRIIFLAVWIFFVGDKLDEKLNMIKVY